MKSNAVFAFSLLLIYVIASLTVQEGRADEGHRQVSRERVLGQKAIPVYGYEIINTYPHDTASYTEGLVMRNGQLYEGTGRYGLSKLRQNDLGTGKAIKEIQLDPLYFGEGVTVLGDRIYQLTYLSNTGFLYDRETLKRERKFRFATQGWGLTTDGKQLLMSDGSSSIHFLDPHTLEVEGNIFVSDDLGPVGFLNELEFVDGKVYANVWQTSFIAVIDAASGKIIGWIDLEGLNPDPERLKYPYVLNGIAYDETRGHFLVTGKCWPNLYEISLVRRSE